MKRVLLVASILILVCRDEPGRSLVGAGQIASDDVLAQENVRLWFRKYGDADIHRTFSYTLATNGVVTVERGRDHSVCCYGGIDRHDTDGARRYLLEPERSAQIRRMLARLRPERLSAEIPLALPQGCSFIMDGGATGGVGFQHGRNGGAFVFQTGCIGEGAERVRVLLQEVIQLLPESEAAAEFLPELRAQ